MNVKQNVITHSKYILEKTVLLICTLFMLVWFIWSIGTWLKYNKANAQSNTGAIATGTQQQLPSRVDTTDSNLINKKPVSRWRLNKNGYSQRYFELSWDRVERMKQLLLVYNRDADELYPTIKAIGKLNNVYPEVIICIAYADSSLGKHLKTKNNVGNVGNNDRWDTQEYRTAEKWFEAIAITLNNKYLKYIYTIDYLSRYHNKDGKIYASSTDNRHNNVTNCLGMIYNKSIPDNFAFRF